MVVKLWFVYACSCVRMSRFFGEWAKLCVHIGAAKPFIASYLLRRREVFLARGGKQRLVYVCSSVLSP